MKKNTIVFLVALGVSSFSFANAAEMGDSTMMKDDSMIASSGAMMEKDAMMMKDDTTMMSDTMKKEDAMMKEKMMMDDKMMKSKMMFQGALDKVSDAKIKKISGKIEALKAKINASGITEAKKAKLLDKIWIIESIIAERMSKMDTMMMEDKMMK